MSLTAHVQPWAASCLIVEGADVPFFYMCWNAKLMQKGRTQTTKGTKLLRLAAF